MITVATPSHWLNEDGSFPTDPRLHARAIRLAQCIEAGGSLQRGQARETLIACRRRPGGQTCLGLLWVLKQNDDAIHAFCGLCKADEYLIYEWEDTLWAEGPMDPVDVAELAAETDQPRTGPRPAGLEVLLDRALTLLRSPLRADEARRIVERSPDPSTMVQAVLATAATPPSLHSVERLVPVLMDLWNTTPRAEFGGHTPDIMHAAGATAPRVPRPGRNDPCPCGSGRKYKKCCRIAAPH